MTAALAIGLTCGKRQQKVRIRTVKRYPYPGAV